jgi:hypothetical protein
LTSVLLTPLWQSMLTLATTELAAPARMTVSPTPGLADAGLDAGQRKDGTTNVACALVAP